MNCWEEDFLGELKIPICDNGQSRNMDLIPLEEITEGVPSTVLEGKCSIVVEHRGKTIKCDWFWRILTGEIEAHNKSFTKRKSRQRKKKQESIKNKNRQ